MLKKALEYYNQLLQDNDLAESSRQMLNEKLEEARLIFGGRPLSPYLRPHFVTESDWKRVTEICETIFSALQKVKDAAVGNDEILDELGVYGIERDLVSIDQKYNAISPTSRLDSFLTDDAFSFVELNGESPAGIAFSDSASKIFLSLPIVQKFAERFEFRTLEGSTKMLDVLIKTYAEFCNGNPKPHPTIAIIDLKDLPTVKEFELFRDFFIENGYPAIICSPEDVVFENGRLRCGETEIDIIYKRLLVNEYLPIVEKYPAILDAYRAGAVCMVNSFQCKLIHKKAVFAVLTNEKYAHLFDENEHEKIKAHVPWTRKFRNETTLNNGEEINLIEWTRANKSKLVLKPNDDYGGHGIYIGWVSDEKEWNEAIEFALNNGDYLVQERVKTSKEIFPYLDGENIVMSEQLVDLDPLLFFGKVGSAFTRLSTTELANVSSGGGMVPTFILKD